MSAGTIYLFHKGTLFSFFTPDVLSWKLPNFNPFKSSGKYLRLSDILIYTANGGTFWTLAKSQEKKKKMGTTQRCCVYF